MDYAIYIAAFFTLFVVIDPIGLTPIFVALTTGMPPRERFRIALRACMIAGFILIVFGLAGEALLGFVGISMAAFRISGGLLLFATALDMLFERRSQRREDKAGALAQDPSVFPLAMPLIAGPGAMATMILLAGNGDLDWIGLAMMHLMMLAVISCCFALFLASPLIERAVGATGIKVVTRLLGMLLAALSVQFVLDGLSDLGVLP